MDWGLKADGKGGKEIGKGQLEKRWKRYCKRRLQKGAMAIAKGDWKRAERVIGKGERQLEIEERLLEKGGKG